MSTKKNQIENTEVNNEVINDASNINSFRASIFQIDKNNDLSFELILSGTTDKTDEENYKQIAYHLANKTFKVLNLQSEQKEKYNLHRVMKFAAGKPVYFYFQLNGETIFNTEFFNSLKVKLCKMSNEEQLNFLIERLIDIMVNCENISL